MSIDGLHRLVIVGGGVAGLELASALGRRARADSNRDERMTVTLVDRDSAHVWKPMLHTIAAGTQDLSQQQTPYLAQARAAGFTYEPGQFCGLTASGEASRWDPCWTRPARPSFPSGPSSTTPWCWP